jgi:hypothetical protein
MVLPSLIAPPLLTGVRAGQRLWENPYDRHFLIFGWGKLHYWYFSQRETHQKTFWQPQPRHPRAAWRWKIIILIDSDEENKALEEKTAGIESTTASASADPTSSAPTSADNAPAGAKIDNSEDQGPDQEADGGDDGGCSTGKP